MRIGISGWFWNRPDTGSGQYLRRLLAVLVASHPEDEFLLFAPPDHVQDQAALLGVQWAPVPVFGPSALGKVWWEQVSVPRWARRLSLDLLHVPYWAPPMQLPCPTVVTIHDLIPVVLPAYRGGPFIRLYTALVMATALRATHLLTDSEAARTDIVQRLHIAEGKVTAIPLATDAAYTPTAQPEDAQILRDLAVEPGYVLYLGGFDVRKNLATACAACAQARAALPDLRFVVAGRLPRSDTAFTPHPRRLLREAGLPAEAVRFVGFVPEAQKPALYRGARAFLFPSRYEGFGLPPLEALACGAPVVGSAAASLPEVVGDAGVLTAPDDVAGMAGALIQLCTDAEFHAKLQARAVRQSAKFSWEATAAATYRVYRAASAR